MNRFLKGMDISGLNEIEKNAGVYYDHGIARDPVLIFRDYGINLARIRLWNDPYDLNGEPYGAGTTDLDTVIALAKRAQDAGLLWLLDFHYSDFWADPGKQILPKAWKNYDFEELKTAVYSYTKSVLQTLKKENLHPDYIAVGNEITNGLCWPVCKIPAYDRIAALVSQGIIASREEFPSSKIMIHLDQGGNTELYRKWFTEYFRNGGKDFDAIGLSFYPAWHGTLENLRENLEELSRTYDKELIIAETSYPFTTEDYAQYEDYLGEDRKGPAIKPEFEKRLPYPVSKEGQCAFMKELMSTVSKFGNGFIYWGGELIPREGSSWASPSALEYIHEKGPGGNEWANQAVFDYDGEVLPVMETIKNF
ncbi:MAG: glycosyl hydrolase 53 family protein [Erysipelotrichales bacterium]|nr:glycosyl hydrolase 53 family protein [Erysipelotrichales bacterium]